MIGPRYYRLQWRRQTSRRYRAVTVGLAIVAVLGALVPAGISTENTPIVTGHSSFYNGDGFDPCLASIVGIMRLRVMWFNHDVLVERYNGDGAYIYATELGAPDPTSPDAKLVSSGIFYDFVDPNGAAWHVDEAFYDAEFSGDVLDYNIKEGESPTTWVQTNVSSKRWYTWIVAVSKPIRDDHRGDHAHDWYNFVTILNTCKFRTDNLNNSRHPDEPVTTHPEGMGVNTGHFRDDPQHDHEQYMVGLWVGGQPVIAPVGAETPHQVAGSAGLRLEAYSDPTQGDEFNNE